MIVLKVIGTLILDDFLFAGLTLTIYIITCYFDKAVSLCKRLQSMTLKSKKEYVIKYSTLLFYFIIILLFLLLIGGIIHLFIKWNRYIFIGIGKFLSKHGFVFLLREGKNK